MKFFFPFLLLVANLWAPAHADPYNQLTQPQPIRVGILDSGFTPAAGDNIPFCKDGHREFVRSGNMRDSVAGLHGTLIAHIVAEEAVYKSGYCIVVLKAVSQARGGNLGDYLQALEYATTLNLDILNISLTGSNSDLEETILIKKLLNSGVQIVTSAGNDSKDFTDGCFRYPACLDPRLIVVGTVNRYSNKGPQVDILENGYYKGQNGTSFAAARVTGTIVRKAIELKAALKRGPNHE